MAFERLKFWKKEDPANLVIDDIAELKVQLGVVSAKINRFNEELDKSIPEGEKDHKRYVREEEQKATFSSILSNYSAMAGIIESLALHMGQIQNVNTRNILKASMGDLLKRAQDINPQIQALIDRLEGRGIDPAPFLEAAERIRRAQMP